MRHYQPSIPRVASGLAAAAMTALTLSAFVLLPAKTDSYSDALVMRDSAVVTVSCKMDNEERVPKKS